MEKIENFEYLSGIKNYSIHRGELDDGVSRTLYLFSDIHSVEGECYNIADEDEDEINNSMRIHKYIIDTIESTKKNIDLFVEYGRYDHTRRYSNTRTFDYDAYTSLEKTMKHFYEAKCSQDVLIHSKVPTNPNVKCI